MPDQPGAERDVIWSGRERLPRRPPGPRLALHHRDHILPDERHLLAQEDAR